MLARPFVINTNYYSFELPNLRLESLDMPEGVPSPMAHIALQCELGKEMSKIPEVPGGIVSPEQTDSIQRTAENWMASFPQAYGITNPDMRWDKDYHCVTFQRYQLQAIGHMMIFFPVKLTLTRSVDSMTDTEKNMRQTAVHCALKLMEISRRLLDCLLPINAKFYLATFLIFDTAACLCSAIAHDSDYSLPQREKIIETIGSALIMLDQVRSTKLGATCYAILKRIVPQFPQELTERILHESMSPGSSSTGGGPRTPSDIHHDNQQFPPGYTNSMFGAPPTTSAFDPGMPSSSGMGFYNAGVTMPQLTSLNDLSDMDLGGLSQIWDWGYLGFTA